MRAKYTAISVHFIDHDEAQPAQEFCPAGVMGQDTSVQHVRVGDDQARSLTYRGAGTGGSITIVSTGSNRRFSWDVDE